MFCDGREDTPRQGRIKTDREKRREVRRGDMVEEKALFGEEEKTERENERISMRRKLAVSISFDFVINTGRQGHMKTDGRGEMVEMTEERAPQALW